MPLETVLVVSAILSAFAIFAVVLTWAERRTPRRTAAQETARAPQPHAKAPRTEVMQAARPSPTKRAA